MVDSGKTIEFTDVTSTLTFHGTGLSDESVILTAPSDVSATYTLHLPVSSALASAGNRVIVDNVDGTNVQLAFAPSSEDEVLCPSDSVTTANAVPTWVGANCRLQNTDLIYVDGASGADCTLTLDNDESTGSTDNICLELGPESMLNAWRICANRDNSCLEFYRSNGTSWQGPLSGFN